MYRSDTRLFPVWAEFPPCVGADAEIVYNWRLISPKSAMPAFIDLLDQQTSELSILITSNSLPADTYIIVATLEIVGEGIDSA